MSAKKPVAVDLGRDYGFFVAVHVDQDVFGPFTTQGEAERWVEETYGVKWHNVYPRNWRTMSVVNIQRREVPR